MKKIAYILGFVTLTLVSCKKEIIQPSEDTQEVNEWTPRAGVINTTDSSSENVELGGSIPTTGTKNDNTSTHGDTGGITDPNDDDYSNRKPGKTKK